MFERGSGNGSVLGVSTTAAGIAVLPNTSGNTVLFSIAMLSIVIGVLVILSTVVRMVVKKAYKQ